MSNRKSDMYKAAKEFGRLLDERLAKKIHTTEDSIRYIFFHSMMNKMKYDPNDIILEYPHPAIHRARIDTFIQKNSRYPATALEFKFHKTMSSKTNAPGSQYAGSLLKDIFRLASLQKIRPETDCYMVYATDSEMIGYFYNMNNKLWRFFNNKKTLINQKFINDKSPTFIKSAGTVIDCSVELVLKQDGIYYAIRIYRILT